MKTYQEQSTTDRPPTLGALERHRDQLARRVERICREQGSVVEGFEYTDPAKARTVRGRLLCSLLRNIDEINREICRVIAPGFAPIPSAGFSDRVMRGLVR